MVGDADAEVARVAVGQGESVEVTQQWADLEWPRLIADAGLTIERVQLVVVRDSRPETRSDCAYCQPSFEPLTGGH